MRKTIIFITIAIAILFIALCFAFLLTNQSRKTIKIKYPITISSDNKVSLACESLLETWIIGSSEEHLTDGIKGGVEYGTDKLAIGINQEEGTLSFLTVAALEAGVIDSDPFTILDHNSERLVAIHYDEIWGATNVFSLNKENGLAVWSKTKANFFGYGSPSGDILYLICR